MITQDNITLAQRLQAPTPKFFRTLRTVGIVLAAVGGAIVAAPAAPIVATIGGYLVTAGGAAMAVSSITVDFTALNNRQ